MEYILRSILHVISNLSKQIPKIATRDEAAEKTHSWPVPRRGDRPIPDAIGHSGGVNKGFQALAAEVTGYSKNAFEDGS